MASSPLLVGGLLVLQVDHWGKSYLLGVDAATGANRWKTARDASVNWTSPAVARVHGKEQIVAAGTYALKGYDAETGRELWSVQGLQMQCIPSPVVQADRVYAISGRDFYTLAVRLDGGKGDLTNSHVLWKVRSGAAYVPSPVCVGEHFYYVEDNGWGNCLNAATGERVSRRAHGRQILRLSGGDRRQDLLLQRKRRGDGCVGGTGLQGAGEERHRRNADGLARPVAGPSVSARRQASVLHQ